MEKNISAATAVAAVGAASRHVLLAAKRDDTVAAVTASNRYLCLVDEHGRLAGETKRTDSKAGPTSDVVNFDRRLRT